MSVVFQNRSSLKDEWIANFNQNQINFEFNVWRLCQNFMMMSRVCVSESVIVHLYISVQNRSIWVQTYTYRMSSKCKLRPSIEAFHPHNKLSLSFQFCRRTDYEETIILKLKTVLISFIKFWVIHLFPKVTTHLFAISFHSNMKLRKIHGTQYYIQSNVLFLAN